MRKEVDLHSKSIKKLYDRSDRNLNLVDKAKGYKNNPTLSSKQSLGKMSGS